MTEADALPHTSCGCCSCQPGSTRAQRVEVFSFPSLLVEYSALGPGKRFCATIVSSCAQPFASVQCHVTKVEGAAIAMQDVPGAWKIILVGVFGGLFGSLVDSLLGATLQFSGYNQLRDKVVNYPGEGVHKISGTHILTNNQVNVVSASITAAVTALMCVVLFA